MPTVGGVHVEPVKERATSSALGSYQPALDGLRAVAMSVMLAYHGELQWAKGAFLGLSQFFTLSGFLIVSILLRRRAQHGNVNLLGFWTQRYRRLMPAAMVTLLGVVIFGATVADPLQVKEIPGQITAAAAQVANWYFVYTDKSYINLFAAPSPVQHFWSLAVEEQFYVVMPLVFFALIRWTRSLRTIGAFFAIGSLASTFWMIWLYNHGASLDRLYYGTDTRAAELLMGGLLAVVLHRFPLNLGSLGRKVMVGVGFLAFAFMIWGWTHLELADGPVWRGGFLVISLVSCALIVSLLSGGPLTWLLSWGFLPAMGRITYGLYLYHWPLFLWLDEETTGLDSWSLFAVRMVVTFVLAIASYNLMEMPIRNGFPDRLKGPIRWAVAPTVAISIVAVALVAGNREVTVELTPLATPVSDVAPSVGGDGVLDVLAIPDASTARVTAALQARAATTDSLDVTVAEPFACEGLAPIDAGETCSNWIDEWPSLVERVDPDVVLFYVGSWDAAQIEQLSGLSAEADPAAATAWAASVLQSGLELLTQRGASVVWTRLPQTVVENLRNRNDPFTSAMAQVARENQSVRQILDLEYPEGIDVTSDEFSDPAIDVLVPGLQLYARSESSDAPRVMVVGDSAARTMGYGLERWAADTGSAVVWTTATVGCGVADEGLVADPFTPGSESPLADACRQVHEGWKRQIAQFDPDLVIVLSTVWDLQDRRLTEWDTMGRPGDPRFDEYLLREYRDSVDELSANGASVLWIKGPCTDTSGPGGVPGTGAGSFDIGRVRYLDNVLIPRLIEVRPQVKTFDLFSVLCPDGQYVESLGGVAKVRPDGVHFSTDGSIWLATEYGDKMVEAGLG